MRVSLANHQLTKLRNP